MELKLNIYEDRFCRKLKREATANTFDLSTGICEDILDIINIDMLDGGLSALSNESTQEIAIGIVKNGFPFFMELFTELFEMEDGEIRYTKIEDLARVVVEIVKYSINSLKSSLGGKKAKN